MRLLDPSAVLFIGERPKHRDGFRRAEGHVPAGGMLARATAILSEPVSGLGIEAAERGFEFRLRHRAAKAQSLGAFTGPAAGGLYAARIIFIAPQMGVIGERRLCVAPRRDRRHHGSMPCLPNLIGQVLAETGRRCRWRFAVGASARRRRRHPGPVSRNDRLPKFRQADIG